MIYYYCCTTLFFITNLLPVLVWDVVTTFLIVCATVQYSHLTTTLTSTCVRVHAPGTRVPPTGHTRTATGEERRARLLIGAWFVFSSNDLFWDF